jgi:hypothetical protein
VATAKPPAWRRAFDGVERRVSPRLAATTSSPDFQVLAQTLRRATRLVSAPVGSVTTWGLHVAGLPTHDDVRQLRRQLGEVQRDMLALRRSVEPGESTGSDPT